MNKNPSLRVSSRVRHGFNCETVFARYISGRRGTKIHRREFLRPVIIYLTLASDNDDSPWSRARAISLKQRRARNRLGRKIHFNYRKRIAIARALETRTTIVIGRITGDAVPYASGESRLAGRLQESANDRPTGCCSLRVTLRTADIEMVRFAYP